MKVNYKRLIYLILSVAFIILINITIAFAQGNSTAPKEDEVTITNNSGISDTVEVSGLLQGDLVKIYSSASGGKLLGSSSCDDNDVTINIKQLGTLAAGNWTR